MNRFNLFLIAAAGVGAYALLSRRAPVEDRVFAGLGDGRLMSSGTGDPMSSPTSIYAFEAPSFSEPMSFETQGIAPPSKKEASTSSRSISRDSVYSGGYSVADSSQANFSTASGAAYVPPPSSINNFSTESGATYVAPPSKKEPNFSSESGGSTYVSSSAPLMSVATKKDEVKSE